MAKKVLRNEDLAVRWLPRPHTRERRIERARDDYRERQRQHHERFPDYEKGWGRPSPTTVGAIVDLIKPDVPCGMLPALVVALDAAIQAGEDGRLLTTNLVFDAIAARWSDWYRQAREGGPARVSWEMSKPVLKASWHDLLLNDIRLEQLLPIVHQGCGLYTLGRNPGRGFTVDLTSETAVRRAMFIGYLEKDITTGSTYRRRATTKRVLLGKDRPVLDDAPEFEDAADPTEAAATRKVIAGWSYNVAVPGAKSLEVIRALEATRLYGNAKAVADEVAGLEHRRDEINVQLWDTYKVNMEKSNVRPDVVWMVTDPRTGKQRRAKVPTPRERELRKKVGRQDWKAVAQLVKEYDRVTGQLLQLKPIGGQLQGVDLDAEGEVEIRSRFAKLSNRRYQSLDFWPTEVSGNRQSMESEEIEWHEFGDDIPSGPYDIWRPTVVMRKTSRRGRLFRMGSMWSAEERARRAQDQVDAQGGVDDEGVPLKARPAPGRQELVGVDVSASQLQILAVFLGLKDLEAELKKRPYKEIAAERVWQRHRKRRDPFKLPAGFKDAHDPALQEAVKKATMTYLYGSAPYTIARTLATEGVYMGSGKNIELFLDDKALGFHEIETRFKPACVEIARRACKADRYAGLVLTDPYDNAQVRWNPVAWKLEDVAGSDAVRVYAKVPFVASYTMAVGKTGKRHPRHSWERAEPNAAGDYPVSRDKLYHMVGPCLTHMLDALFASLVIEELESWGVQVISIHDAWIVPADAADALAKAVKAAGKPWLEKLWVVYDDMARYLPERTKHGRWVRQLKTQWGKRMARGDWPRFRVGDVRPVETVTE